MELTKDLSASKIHVSRLVKCTSENCVGGIAMCHNPSFLLRLFYKSRVFIFGKLGTSDLLNYRLVSFFLLLFESKTMALATRVTSTVLFFRLEIKCGQVFFCFSKNCKRFGRYEMLLATRK